MNVYEGSLVATGLKVGIVVARFNGLVTEQLLQGAADALRRHGVKDGDIDVFRCPGTFELPALLRRVARSGRYDAVLALGAVIRGGTPHFDLVAAEAARGIGALAAEARVPVAFGVLACDTLEQALERSGEKKEDNRGHDAAMVVVEMADLSAQIAGAR